jgi:hypothetical protein
MGRPVEVRVLSRATLNFYSWRRVHQLLQQKAGQHEPRGTGLNRPIYLLPPFLLAAHRAFINWESRFRPAGVIPPFFTEGVAFV